MLFLFALFSLCYRFIPDNFVHKLKQIDEKAFQVPYDNTKDFYDLQFIKGAKWMRNLIQGGNK